MAGLLGPVTPAKQVGWAETSMQDSPFSDYFSEARSSGGARYHAPSLEIQQLLVRLNKLQAQLMRAGEEERDVVSVVGRRMSEIDRDLNAMHSQTRQPPELEDSGLFMDETPQEETRSISQHSGDSYFGGLDGASDASVPNDVTPENKQAELDYQLLEAQRVLEDITHANNELRKRHAELTELNNAYVEQLEQKEAELERLRLENEALKSDLGFDHSELLFLKLQFEAIEVEVQPEEQEQNSQVNPVWGESPRVQQYPKMVNIAKEMDQWRSDWHDVDARFKRRRATYGVLSPDDDNAPLGNGQGTETDDVKGGEWHVEVIKESSGKFNSITVRRVEESFSNRTQDPPDVVPKATLSSQGTQTEVAPIPAKPIHTDQGMQTEDSWYVDLRTPIQNTYLEQQMYRYHDDDCAITTSPATPEQPSPVIEPLAPPVKTAWRELWEGLSSLAGMDLDEDDE